MPTPDTSKDKPGRSLDQLTDGSTSAATMGAGATGSTGATKARTDSQQRGQQGARQQGDPGAGRTDDLLAGGSEAEQSDRGFREVQQGSQAGKQQDGKR